MISGHVFIEDLTVKVNGLDRACGGMVNRDVVWCKLSK